MTKDARSKLVDSLMELLGKYARGTEDQRKLLVYMLTQALSTPC